MAIGAMIQLHTKSSVSNAERISSARVILITAKEVLEKANNCFLWSILKGENHESNPGKMELK